MNVCANCTRYRKTERYKLALSRTTAELCVDCFAALSAIGMTWVPVPVVERRQPAWLSRITAREIA